MQMTNKRYGVSYLPHTCSELGVAFRKDHTESLGSLWVNLSAIYDFITAVNNHNLRVVFIQHLQHLLF